MIIGCVFVMWRWIATTSSPWLLSLQHRSLFRFQHGDVPAIAASSLVTANAAHVSKPIPASINSHFFDLVRSSTLVAFMPDDARNLCCL
jgi:hypothetical protein